MLFGFTENISATTTPFAPPARFGIDSRKNHDSSLGTQRTKEKHIIAVGHKSVQRCLVLFAKWSVVGGRVDLRTVIHVEKAPHPCETQGIPPLKELAYGDRA